MNKVQFINVTDAYRPFLEEFWDRIRLRMRAKILIVVDTEISLTPGPGAFGIGRVISLIRNATAGCMKFQVRLAVRDGSTPATNANPTATQPKYTGFRFDQKEADSTTNTIDLYHEIWCFGFKPGNDAGPDSNIEQPSAFPTSNAELAVLATWMKDRQGGLFATGDHDYLGASMCSRIPRVGTMRRWTNADGVPPIGGLDRIDTNRPNNAAQGDIGGIPEMMPFNNQGDAVPQPIQWVAWSVQRWTSSIVRRRPHPVLCHPTRGPIDVMPDHPHEGACFDTAFNPATGRAEINLTDDYDFNGVQGPEYPTVNGLQPTPMVIAYGTTLPDPPYNHFKGDSPFKRFPMISVYDGHLIDHGRVAVDSTWHHWMDVNLTGIEAAADPAAWEKISRYFINLAVWLAPASIPRACFVFELFESHFEYLGFREFSPRANIFDLGAAFRTKLHQVYGPCWVTQLIFDWLRLIDFDLHVRLLDYYFEKPKPRPEPEPCWSCPPLEMLEDAILGGMVLESIDAVRPLREGLDRKGGSFSEFDFDSFEKTLVRGVGRGFQHITQILERSEKRGRELFTVERYGKDELGFS